MKAPKSQMIERLVRISSTGISTGSVTSLKTRHARAPSICAASTKLVRNLRERRVDGDRDEGERPPDDQRRHHRVLRERRLVPVVLEVVADVQLGEDVVEDAVLAVRHPAPDLDGDDRRHRPDEDEPGGEQEPHPGRDADEKQRNQRPEPRSSGRRSTAVKTTVRNSVCQKTGSWRTLRKLSQPDVRRRGAAISANRSYFCEREPDEVVDRVAEDRREHGNRPAATSRYGTDAAGEAAAG